MRLNLLGLELEAAKALLEKEGICPQVTVTSAPRRQGAEEGVMRVVYASGDGSQLTAARFLDPLGRKTASGDRD